MKKTDTNAHCVYEMRLSSSRNIYCIMGDWTGQMSRKKGPFCE